ncbi:MAG: restriction endonuclease subunit S [Rhodospirillales bacterium]|nr:restriction endonuclease subunit S [Rhodospirillales bacterium]
MSFPRYPKYKPSGVEWLGDVPEGWGVVPIKWLSPVKRGASPRPIDDPKYFDEEGEYAWVRIADVSACDGDLNETTQRLSQLGSSLSVKISPGELFVSIAGTVGKPCIAAIKACIHDGFVYFPTLEIAPRFLYRIFEAGICYGGLGKWGTQLNLNTDTVGSIRVAVPPVDELNQVLEFLDRETGKIDGLVAEQRRLMELLKEKRQAVISHAVTKGLNPHAPMKPSGIEWLGDVPAGWEVLKLGIFSRFKGGAGFPDTYQGQTQNEIPFFKVGDMVNADGARIMRQANHTVTVDTVKELRAFVFPAGTIVFAKVGAALLLKRYRLLGQPSCIDNNLMGMNLDVSASVEFLLYVLPLLDLELIVNPGAVPSMNEGQISAQKIELPSLAEQRAIVEHLDTELLKFDTLTAEAQRAIDLLQERRTALISAAVTGQIDVRQPKN